MAFGAAADSTASTREVSEDHGSPSCNDNKDEHETGIGEGTMHSEHHGPQSPGGEVSPVTWKGHE